MGIQAKLPSSALDDLTRTLRFPSAGPSKEEVRTTFLPAEWHPQSGVMLSWPHAATDWAPYLGDVEHTYLRLAYETARRERLLIVAPDGDHVWRLLGEHLPERALRNVSIAQLPTDDTWARDHAFLTLLTSQGPTLLDFRFNGWGQKFKADLDNQINRRLMTLPEGPALRGVYEPHPDFVLEGGSIESDGAGTLLTTSDCLLAPHRNEPLRKHDIEARLLRVFHARRVLWLHHGHLEGDDTDGHIDTLARFCPAETIAYVKADDPRDTHYESLARMEEELRQMRTLAGRPYRLIPLPLPRPVYDGDERLPATYANFLILNGAVLLPTYAQTDLDHVARQRLQEAFPRHEIIPIDSRTLIRQHGSIHCSAMQFPLGVL